MNKETESKVVFWKAICIHHEIWGKTQKAESKAVQSLNTNKCKPQAKTKANPRSTEPVNKNKEHILAGRNEND